MARAHHYDAYMRRVRKSLLCTHAKHRPLLHIQSPGLQEHVRLWLAHIHTVTVMVMIMVMVTVMVTVMVNLYNDMTWSMCACG